MTLAATRTAGPSMTHAQFARRLIADRRARASILGSDLFADPAWDMLLEMFGAYGDGGVDYLGSRTDGMCRPSDTMARWISALEERGLLSMQVDQTDRRRRVLSLSRHGAELMRKYLELVASNWDVSLE